MIPKVIHYCWFGENKIPDEQQKFIDDWQNKCPDWQIKQWNESNFDINAHRFTKTAYEHKKFAFVADFVRVWALHNYGGVYLDTDVELKANIDIFLKHQAFSCLEKSGIPFTSAVWGSCPQHSLTGRMLNYYENRDYQQDESANTITISDILEQHYGIDKFKDQIQVGKDTTHSIHIYSSNYFCLDLPINYASHHFIGSWLDKDKQHHYKEFVHSEYYTAQFLNNENILNNKDTLKSIAKALSFKNLLSIIRYFIKYRFK